ncbi:MAG: formylglycine-generating enzyme family protein, partial [Lentisphaerae bacterium]|nr:formylglycine-generating enzyme family protein [Lentisphaerota bacterium]
AGTFMMGSPADEEWRGANETLHQVTLTQNFYVGVFEVTQKQWERVMGTWPSYFKNSDYRDSRPVDYLYFKDIRGSTAGSGWPANNAVDADSFLGRLRSKTGLAFDLPTEAQWEYACRAGTETALNSGKNLTANQTCPNMNEVGRYTSNGGLYNPADGDTTKGTAKVGSYLPNQWGLYDMHGNVFEYCLDWWDGSDYPAEAVTDPKGNAGGSGRVIRGGYYRADAEVNCSARRNKTPPNIKSNGMGFRLAWPIP